MGKHTFFVRRTPPAPPSASGAFRAGAAERDITPPFGLRMAGYSLGGKRSQGVWGRLFARALMLEDARGERACLCVCDLMSGTRALLEKVAQRTGPSAGISVDRLLLAGTHTHNGPGGFYGNALYDTLADRGIAPGFEPDLTDWLALRVALAIEQAAAAMEPAAVGSASLKLWNVSRNRSHEAFPDAGWNDAGSGTPGEGAPDGLSVTQRRVDPRVRLVGAFREHSRAPIAVFGFFGCHYHATGPDTALYTSDAAGIAVQTARWELERSPGVTDRVIVAVGASCAADVHTYRTLNMSDPLPPSLPLARWVGERLGARLAEAATAAGQRASAAGSIEVRFAEPDHGTPTPGDPPDTRLAAKWCFGAPTLTGSEETKTEFEAFVKEGQTGNDFKKKHPQHPKSLAFGPAQKLVKKLLALAPCPVYPLHQLRIGPTVVATLPGEITTVGAWEIERALGSALPDAEEILVVGYGGDYGGYFTTEAEYREQHYEGASTLYGRNVHRYLLAFHLALAASGPQPPPSGTVAFRTTLKDPAFDPRSITFSDPDPDPSDPEIDPVSCQVRFSWRMHEQTHLVLAAEGPLVRLEEEDGATWRTVTHLGRDFDDYWHNLRIRCEDPGRWETTLVVPDAAVGRTLRIRVLARSRFPGTLSRPFTIQR
jgi:neutral ceramidase